MSLEVEKRPRWPQLADREASKQWKTSLRCRRDSILALQILLRVLQVRRMHRVQVLSRRIPDKVGGGSGCVDSEISPEWGEGIKELNESRSEWIRLK